jgi:hypothetical protein
VSWYQHESKLINSWGVTCHHSIKQRDLQISEDTFDFVLFTRDGE